MSEENNFYNIDNNKRNYVYHNHYEESHFLHEENNNPHEESPNLHEESDKHNDVCNNLKMIL